MTMIQVRCIDRDPLTHSRCFDTISMEISDLALEAIEPRIAWQLT